MADSRSWLDPPLVKISCQEYKYRFGLVAGLALAGSCGLAVADPLLHG